MKVLVTGGAGQVGSHVAELLAARGNQVVCIDNLATGREAHVKVSDTTLLIKGSIADIEVFNNPFGNNEKADVVVHTAASYSDSNAWEEDSRTNILGTINSLRYAQESNARLIYFQTALCYGTGPTIQPVPLDYPRVPAPTSYGISKTAGEFYIEQSGIDFVTFRLANIVGPRNLAGALPIFYKRLSTGQRCMIAEARRDFVDVRDLASVVVQAVDGRGSGAYHFSSGKDISILEMFNAVASALQLEPKPDYDKAPSLGSNPATILLDPARTYADFDMPELTDFRDTVKAAVEYYKEFGVDRELTHLKAAKS
jgi:nucleoside-diphosphate-sugar epimerase